ncbi:MAG: D-lyxose/D-mannose family sugar isomerase [Eubacteriales bacterium]
MKRSEINRAISNAITIMRENKFPLPPFAYWTISDWRTKGEEYKEIVDNMLGWDITDFGSGKFHKIGLTVFTFRNGNFNNKEEYPKPYAEKLLLVNEGQVLPFHFHWSKMEDIINRGGGNLSITLYNSDDKEGFAKTDVEVVIDGKKVIVEAGGKVILHPGESITLFPGQYHSWQGLPETGNVILFEVSTTNDDRVDNRFYSAEGRLPDIEEDEDPKYLIFKDYNQYVEFHKLI